MYEFYRATIVLSCELPHSLRLKLANESPKASKFNSELLLCVGQNIRRRAGMLTAKYLWREKKEA